MIGRYMIATTAVHKVGDISRDEPDLCYVRDEDDEAYIGHWVYGFGFGKVRFPKATTRELTAEERQFYDGKLVQLSSYEPCPLQIKPVTHYGNSAWRINYTACGKYKPDGVFTSFPEQVTCEACIEELKLREGKEAR